MDGFFVKENIHFCFYARGSLLEAKSWIRKSYQRGLINETTYGLLIAEMELIHRKLNGYIKVLKNNIHH